MVTIEGDADGFAVSRLSAQGEVMAQVRFVTKQNRRTSRKRGKNGWRQKTQAARPE